MAQFPWHQKIMGKQSNRDSYLELPQMQNGPDASKDDVLRNLETFLSSDLVDKLLGVYSN